MNDMIKFIKPVSIDSFMAQEISVMTNVVKIIDKSLTANFDNH